MKRYLLVTALCGAVMRVHAAFDAPVVESVEVLQKEAELGDAIAQYQLAQDYRDGKEVAKDPQKALAWLRRAAAAGLARAQYDLGVMLANGADVPKADKEAARWFYAAAQSGIFEAQTAMIELYSAGRGVASSPANALAWDMIARRALQLRTGVDAGLPHKPPTVRSDGAAEVVDSFGTKTWVKMLADGTRAIEDAAGVRHLEYKNGATGTVQKDGSWEVRYPNGVREGMTADGRRSYTDAKGTVATWELDGSHRVEGDGTTTQSQHVRVCDTFDVAGKRISHRVQFADFAIVEREDGSKFVETEVKCDDGVAMILKEDVQADGKQTNGRLRRAGDGVGPKGSEIWAIRRTLHLEGGKTAVVMEKYSEAGRYSQEVISMGQQNAVATITRTTDPMPPSMWRPIGTPPWMPGTMVVTQTQTMVPVGGGVQYVGSQPVSNFEDPTAFAAKPDIQPMLGTLGKIESDTLNFAGATQADYDKAEAGAQTYFLPVTQPPQKPTATSAWLREKTITQSTLHEPPLLPIPDDRSSKVPLGVYGSRAIALQPWKHAETEHFIVHYMHESEAKLTMQYIEGTYTVLTELLNFDSRYGGGKSHVFIFPEVAKYPEVSWSEFQRKNDLPPEVAGFAFRTELLLGASTNQKDKPETTKVICHEVTHALVSRFYPGLHGPLWLNEGLAEYIALRTMRAKGTLPPSTAPEEGTTARRSEESAAMDHSKARANAEARIMHKSDKEIDVARLFTRVRYGNRTTPDRMDAFYGNSQKAVETLFEKLPLEKFPRFFNLVMAGNEPGISLATAYGKQCDGTAAFAEILNRP